MGQVDGQVEDLVAEAHGAEDVVIVVVQAQDGIARGVVDGLVAGVALGGGEPEVTTCYQKPSAA